MNNASGTTSLTGTEVDIYEHSNVGGTAVDIVASSADGIIQVTGIAAQTINWTTYSTWTRAK